MIAGDRPPEALGAYTGFLMNWVGTRSRARFTEAIGSLGLHPREFLVLTMLDARPGIAQQELVDATFIDPSTMTMAIDGLEGRGLAERRVHADDRRKRAVWLTDAGQETLEAARAAARNVGEEAFAALTKDERAELHRLLRKLSGLDGPESH
jgi:DNA-binding MarR family transcriptional regulator